MKKFRNKNETIRVGKRIRDLRETSGFTISDIADMTGFTYPTISAIEGGEESTLSYLLEIAKALGVHPSEILNISFVIKPRYELSPQKKERNLLTQRVTLLCNETDFFNNPKFVREVAQHLSEEFKIKTNSTSIAVVLKRLTDSGKLKYKKIGRQNQYVKKRK